MRRLLLFTVFALAVSGAGHAAEIPASRAGCTGTVATGSESVSVDGKPAARTGDQTGCGQIVEGSSNVFINGKPAAVMGSGTDCGGTVAGGSSGVFINGKPMARTGDAAGCR